jgi:hypothetical protein
MLEFVMLLVKLTWSLVRVSTNSWMERSIPIFTQRASGSTYIYVEHVPDRKNY